MIGWLIWILYIVHKRSSVVIAFLSPSVCSSIYTPFILVMPALSVAAEAEPRVRKKRFVGGTAHLREQTTRPCLRRLTRRVLQVAELLPWPVKDGLSRTRDTPCGALGGESPSFLEGTVLNQRTDG
ncbi:hypothetical protein BC835DRAFT_546647 [Cytidiella melzeri]|nr:hypothetical protein BC835DRAFT_546647 [Cytidiella melzeri]